MALIVVPLLIAQLAGFLRAAAAYAAQLQALGDRFFDDAHRPVLQDAAAADTNIDQMVSQGASWIATFVASIWAGGQAVISVVSLIVVTPVVAFYLLYDWDRMIARIDALLPREHAETIRTLGRDIDVAIAGFIRGQGARLPDPRPVLRHLALGGRAEFRLPDRLGRRADQLHSLCRVDRRLRARRSASRSCSSGRTGSGSLAVVGVFAVGQFIEGNILQPRLVGSSIGVHPVWLMFALFAFGSLFGFVGVLLAVPVTAAIGVLVRFAVERYRESASTSTRDERGPPRRRR